MRNGENCDTEIQKTEQMCIKEHETFVRNKVKSTQLLRSINPPISQGMLGNFLTEEQKKT